MSIHPAWQENADVVVIGTGVGGLAAALAAHRAGRTSPRPARAVSAPPRGQSVARTDAAAWPMLRSFA